MNLEYAGKKKPTKKQIKQISDYLKNNTGQKELDSTALALIKKILCRAFCKANEKN